MIKVSTKRQSIIDEALTWIDTPYQHQARVKGAGVDCAMLVTGVAYNIGLVTSDDLVKIPNYPRDWHLHKDEPILTKIMESFGCVEINANKAKPGDIVVFQLGRCASHLGILLQDNKVIHAFGGSINKVIVNELSGKWKERMIQVYKFPGVK